MLSFFRGAQNTVLRMHLPLLCCFAVFHFKPAFSPRLLRAGLTGSITMEPRPYGVASQRAHCAGGTDPALFCGEFTVCCLCLVSTASLVGMVSGTHDGRDMRCVCSVGLRNKFLKCSKKTPNAHIDSCLHAIILQCGSWSGHGWGFEGTVCRFGLISPVCVASRFICTLSIQSKGSNAKDQKRYRTDAMAPAISALFAGFINIQLFTCLKFHNRSFRSGDGLVSDHTIPGPHSRARSACARPQTCSTIILLFRLFTNQVLNQMPGALPFPQPLA